MLSRSYAYTRFRIFCQRFDDEFTHQIKKVLSNADNAFFDLENEVLGMDDAPQSEADRYLSRETHQIKRETLTALQSVIDDFFHDVQPLRKVEKKPARNRIIKRDVACRYLRVFGGHTEWIQTDADNGYPILIDADGERRGMIDAFDRFQSHHKAVSEMAVSEIPY